MSPSTSNHRRHRRKWRKQSQTNSCVRCATRLPAGRSPRARRGPQRILPPRHARGSRDDAPLASAPSIAQLSRNGCITFTEKNVHFFRDSRTIESRDETAYPCYFYDSSPSQLSSGSRRRQENLGELGQRPRDPFRPPLPGPPV